MTVVEKYRPKKTWSELPPKELMKAVRHLGRCNFGRGGVDPNWLRSFITQSTGEDGLSSDQAKEAEAIIAAILNGR